MPTYRAEQIASGCGERGSWVPARPSHHSAAGASARWCRHPVLLRSRRTSQAVYVSTSRSLQVRSSPGQDQSKPHLEVGTPRHSAIPKPSTSCFIQTACHTQSRLLRYIAPSPPGPVGCLLTDRSPSSGETLTCHLQSRKPLEFFNAAGEWLQSHHSTDLVVGGIRRRVPELRQVVLSRGREQVSEHCCHGRWRRIDVAKGAFHDKTTIFP